LKKKEAALRNHELTLQSIMAYFLDRGGGGKGSKSLFKDQVKKSVSYFINFEQEYIRMELDCNRIRL
jgi:hypothetical protein